MLKDIPDSILVAISVAIFVGGSVWGLAWWLSGQFGGVRSLVYDLIHKTESNIISKLEYHEKHDDGRFDDLKRDIWEMKLRAASGKAKKED